MKIIQLAHRTVDELLEEIFAITSKQEIDTNDRRVLYALACAMKNRYENDVPKWIPVSERLPEKNGEYLVTTQWWNGDIDTSLYEYGATHKEWNDGDMCGQKVIAWMPLPEAYKPNK